MENQNNILLFGNLAIYLLTFIAYQRRRRYFSVGSLYLLYLVVTCALAWLCFNTPNVFYTFNNLTLFPFIYLFFCLILTAYPFLNLNEREVSLVQPSKKAFYLLCIIIILMSAMQIIDVVKNFRSGVGAMIWDITSGASLYSEMLRNAEDSGQGISNIYAIIGGSFSNLAVLFAFCLLTRDKINIPMLIGLILCFLVDIMASVASGARGNVVIKSLTIIFAFMLVRQWIPDKIRKRVELVIAGLIIVVAIPVIMLTIGRFSEGRKIDKAVANSMIYYSGQSMLNFNNYGLDAGGIRYGDRTANLFKRIVKPDTPINYQQRRAKYNNLKIDDYYFYTFVGDFTLDYGPIWAVIIFVLATILFTLLSKPKDGCLAFHQLIVLYFVLCVCAQGIMCLFSFSDTGGGLKIITTMLTYFYFKADYYINAGLVKI